MGNYSHRLLLGIGLVLGVSIAAFLHTSNAGAANSSWLPPGSRPITESVTDPCLGQIAFSSFRDLSGRGEIYLMNTDGSAQTGLTNNTALDDLPSWSPSGLEIAFQSDRDNLLTGRSDIYVMDAGGGNVRRLTTNPAFDESPAWSPDGAKIAFISTRDDPNNNIRQLYVMNSDGSGQTRLTFGDSIQPLMTWSPDSSKIAFSAPVGGGNPPDILRLYTISASGGAASALTNPSAPETDIQPAWSPDGKQLAFARLRSGENGNSDVYVINAQTGGEMKNLTGTLGADTSPAWSPDGSAIAFVSERDGHREIYVMYPDGSGQTDLTHNYAHDQDPSWRPAPTAAPCLLNEFVSQRGVALESVNFLRDPFSVMTNSNFSQDHHTRLSLFARNIALLPGDGPSVVTAQAEDAQNLYPLEVEFVGQVPNLSWLTQVNVRLPDTLPDSGDLNFSVTKGGNQSNKIVVKMALLTANPH